MNDTRTLELADDLCALYEKHRPFFEELRGDLWSGDRDEVEVKCARLWLQNAIMCARRAAKGTHTTVCDPQGRERWL